MHSKEGIRIPVAGSYNPKLQGSVLLDLQARCSPHNPKRIVAVILDEYSMLSSKDMYSFNKNLQLAFGNALPFGGVPILFVGDNGQIPPVVGSPVHESTQALNSRPLLPGSHQFIGYKIYSEIKNVMKLTQIHRQQDVEFISFLNRLRDGKNTPQDVSMLNDNCSEAGILLREGESGMDKFRGENVIHILTTNTLCTDYNIKILKELKKPILRIDAKHDRESSKNCSNSIAENLSATLFMAVGAKISIIKNINTKLGLVNGSTGIVKDFFYREGEKAPQLPYAIICEIKDYMGSPFFNGLGREKWVPIKTY